MASLLILTSSIVEAYHFNFSVSIRSVVNLMPSYLGISTVLPDFWHN